MPALKITCTRKTASPEPHLCISHVGGANVSNLPWTLTLAEAIRTLELKQYSFYVMVGTRRAEVVIAYAREGEKYLRCNADNAESQVLAGLPDCT